MTHHELSPSKFPAWAICPAFDSDPAERADATAGTAQHEALAAVLGGDATAPGKLPPDAQESVQWAADYIRQTAGGNPILRERKVAYTSPDAFAPGGTSEVYSGTADAIIIHPPGSLADLIDYKSGSDDRDHRPQLAAYGLALFSERKRLKTIRCHVLYGRGRRVDSWSLTQADAAGIVLPILAARQSSDHTPTACDYCPLCAHRATCPALTAQVQIVGATSPSWEDLAPAIRHPGEITDPTIAAKALDLARFVATWADAIRARATELAKSGATLPGYRLQDRRGSREITDLDTAFERTGLTPGEFMTACKISLPKLSDAVATARKIPKAEATREIETKLADIIREGSPSVSLVQDRRKD